MASRFCTKCGLEIIEGKRFCGGCGQPVAEQPAGVEPESVPAQTVQGQPPIGSPPMPEWQTAAHLYQPPLIIQTPPGQPRRTDRLIIGVVCAALLFVAAATGAYEWRKRSSTPAAADIATNNPSSVESAMSGLPESTSASKPAAGTAVPEPTSAPAPNRDAPHPPATLPNASSVKAPAHVDAKLPSPHSAEPTPAPVPASAPPVPAPIVRQTPETAKAGALHYSGPPIHKGEAVNFPGLPGAMLRFSFDHAVWQPRISHQPNGTQTLTLRSLSPMDQTQCEVRWEIAQ